MKIKNLFAANCFNFFQVERLLSNYTKNEAETKETESTKSTLYDIWKE